MGTHPTLPSRLLRGGGETLGAHLGKHPGLLGGRGLDDLPFLFKVLAIRKALSIQSHPDKAFAERLHAAAPDLYKGAPTLFTCPGPVSDVGPDDWQLVTDGTEQTRTTNPRWPSR